MPPLPLDVQLKRLRRGGQSVPSQIADAGILILLVVAGSLLLNHNPHGWIASNPSPFFLVPLLMGGRYGQVSGILSGAMAGLVLVGATMLHPAYLGRDFNEVVDAGRFVLVCLPASGWLAGELRATLFKDLTRTQILLDHSSARLRSLDEQLFILNESKDELARELSLMNADTANLDFEIRRVFQSPPERFHNVLLNVFCRKARLYEAALYTPGAPDSLWARAAFSGQSATWPEQLDIAASPVAHLAIEHSDIATLPQVWDDKPAPADDYLVACPIGEADNVAAILLVRSMPYSSMNARTMQTIETLCRWVASFTGMEHRTKGLFNPRGIVPAEEFNPMLNLACVAQKKFRLVSSMILFRVPAGNGVSAPEIMRKVSRTLRVGDVLSHEENGIPHAFLLLPLTGRRGAEICAARVVEFSGLNSEGQNLLSADIFCTDDFPDADSLRTGVARKLGTP